MARFIIGPIPEMISQRLLPAFNFRPVIYAIDPTCGRYCLKALLKYWIEVKQGVRVKDRSLLLPRPAKPADSSWLSLSDWVDLGKWDPHWIAYDPFIDFQGAQKYLKRSSKPQSLDGWETHLRTNGPTIVSGALGAASVGHYILLIGADTDASTLIYKDPLTGNEQKEESFASMRDRIDDQIIHGTPAQMTKLPAVVGGGIQL